MQDLPIVIKSNFKHKRPGQITFVQEEGRNNPVLATCRQAEYDIMQPLIQQSFSEAAESGKGKVYGKCSLASDETTSCCICSVMLTVVHCQRSVCCTFRSGVSPGSTCGT